MTLTEELGLVSLPGDLQRVEDRLRTSLATSDRLLSESSVHLAVAGGKRLRPLLALGIAYAAQGGSRPAPAEVITGATAVELIHLGSLYHDDVIDEAPTRRGVDSVNARWNNIVAILAGDYLLAQASALGASLGAPVAILLAETIGDLCRGQMLELEHLFDSDRSEEQYFSSITGKTAALMATSCRVGGITSNLDPVTVDTITNFGRQLGTCFQVIDDLLDVTRDEEELGKPVGKDLLEGVYTLPTLRAMRDSQALRELLGKPLSPAELPRALALIATPDVVNSTLATAREHADTAISILLGLPGLDPAVCGHLVDLVNRLVTRSN